MKAVIIANGNITNYNYFSGIIKKADLIICADGGGNHLKKMKIIPHFIIGDLDSLKSGNSTFYRNNNVKIIKHSPDKDATDTELAVNFAVAKLCSDLTLIGATGVRLDHTLSNIFLLKQLTGVSEGQKVNCRILDDNNEIFIIADSVTIKKTENCFISLLPLSEIVEGVTTKGLKYPLKNAKIKCGSSLGISNQIIDDKAVISLKKGFLMVFKSKD